MTLNEVSLDTGKERLRKLIVEFSPLGDLSNEAETRFHFIDGLLVSCLGWRREEIHVEVSENGERADYELSSPRQAIWEAKKSSLPFDIPARRKSSAGLIYSLKTLREVDPLLEAAIQQCQSYCFSRGVQISVIANGPQVIAFLATRTDGVSPLQGNAIVWNGYEKLVEFFPSLWQSLSPGGVDERRLVQILSGTLRGGIPRKLSSLLFSYPQVRYTNEFQEDLKTVANLLLEDIRNLPDVESEFYRECYCESGALSQFALLTKAVLNSRYAELFSSSQEQPDVSAARQDPKAGIQNAQYLFAEAIAKRPIVLIGDVGVGKTSFLKNLIYVEAAAEFREALYAYIDLGSQFPIEEGLAKAVHKEVKQQLLVRYKIDLEEWAFIHAVYYGDIQRFRRGLWGHLAESDPTLYEQKLREYLYEKTSDLMGHVAASINHIARGRKRPVVIMLDNADQRSFDLQQQAFVLAETLAKTWTAFVFVAVRPRTFHQSKRSGTLAAYPQRVFTIAPPRVEIMVEKRLGFALNMAEGRLPVESIQNLSLKVDSLAAFLKALLEALRANKEIAELLANITGGNMREVMELITRFISTPNVDSKKIIETVIKTGRYRIPLHEFSKVALLGDYSHYNPESSIALNLFDVSAPDFREHFLRPIVLALLNTDRPTRNPDGFVFCEAIVKEMQDLGFMPIQSQSALRRLTNKKLIESSERVTFEEDTLGDLIGDIPAAFRLTSIGAYHLRRWCFTFAYLDAMVFDTPIFKDNFFQELSQSPESFDIHQRIKRAECFRRYLAECWHEAGLVTPFFDWIATEKALDASFASVERGIARQARRQSG